MLLRPFKYIGCSPVPYQTNKNLFILHLQESLINLINHLHSRMIVEQEKKANKKSRCFQMSQMFPTKVVSKCSQQTSQIRAYQNKKNQLNIAGGGFFLPQLTIGMIRNDDFSVKDHKMLPIFFLPPSIHTLGFLDTKRHVKSHFARFHSRKFQSFGLHPWEVGFWCCLVL